MSHFGRRPQTNFPKRRIGDSISRSRKERKDQLNKRRMLPDIGKFSNEENRTIEECFNRISLLVGTENPTIIITIMLLSGEELTDENIHRIIEEYRNSSNDSSFGKLLEMLYRRDINTITLDKSDNRFIHPCESEEEVMDCSVIMVDGNIILPAPKNLCSWVREHPSAVLDNTVMLPKTTVRHCLTLLHVGIIGKEVAEYGSWYFTTPHAAFAFMMEYYIRKCGFSSEQLFVQVVTSPEIHLFVMDNEYTEKDLFNYFVRETGLSQDKVDEDCEGSNYPYAEHMDKLSKTFTTIPKGWIQKRGSSELFGSSILSEEVEYEEVFLTSSARDQVQIERELSVEDFSCALFE